MAVALVLVFVVFKGDDKDPVPTAGGGSPEQLTQKYYESGDFDEIITLTCAADHDGLSDAYSDDPTDFESGAYSDVKVAKAQHQGNLYAVPTTFEYNGTVATVITPVVKQGDSYIVCQDRYDDIQDMFSIDDFPNLGDDFSDLGDYFS